MTTPTPVGSIVFAPAPATGHLQSRIAQLERDLAAAWEELASVKAHAEAMAQLIRMFTWMDKHGVQLPAGLYAQVSEYEAAVLAYRRDFPKDAATGNPSA